MASITCSHVRKSIALSSAITRIPLSRSSPCAFIPSPALRSSASSSASSSSFLSTYTFKSTQYSNIRHFAGGPGSAVTMSVFDRKTKRIQKDRIAKVPGANEYEYLRDYVAERLLDRLDDIKGYNFPIAADMGSHRGSVLKNLKGRGGIKQLYMCDMSENMLDFSKQFDAKNPSLEQIHRICADEEYWPFSDGTLDLVLSNLSMHWINDLPGAMIQVRKSLRPDGLFLASMFGGDTLHELRTSLLLAEQERSGGVSPHTSPMAFVRDAGNLMSRSGFNITTVDHDYLELEFPDMATLMHHLQMMGEGNAAEGRRMHVPRSVFAAADAIYRSMYGRENGTIPATFEVIYMIGWAPAPSQRRPMKRGSAEVKLTDLSELGVRVAELQYEPDEREQRPLSANVTKRRKEGQNPLQGLVPGSGERK